MDDFFAQERILEGSENSSTSKKKVFRAAKKLNSINRRGNCWNFDRTCDRVEKELSLSRSFVKVFLSIFKNDLEKMKDNPNCTSECDFKSVMSFATLLRDMNDDAFIQCVFYFA